MPPEPEPALSPPCVRPPHQPPPPPPARDAEYDHDGHPRVAELIFTHAPHAPEFADLVPLYVVDGRPTIPPAPAEPG